MGARSTSQSYGETKAKYQKLVEDLQSVYREIEHLKAEKMQLEKDNRRLRHGLKAKKITCQCCGDLTSLPEDFVEQLIRIT